MIPPGQTIGIVGGGQLGRMLALTARRMGYRITILDPDPSCPASPVADLTLSAPFDDSDALQRLAKASHVLTYEFENLPIESLRLLATQRPVFPDPSILHICQHRERERDFLKTSGFPSPRCAVVTSATELATAMKTLSGKTRLKSSAFGYDGKGQLTLEPTSDPHTTWQNLQAPRAILEEFVPFVRELSVIIARDAQGKTVSYLPFENRHQDGILDRTLFPARVPSSISDAAQKLAHQIAEKLNLVGLLTVELFQLADGTLWVNELAPRVHNSGHLTAEACPTSQFEQQLRAVCGLPLGHVSPTTPAAMFNLLGDLWHHGEPDWAPLFALPGASLHLYGKAQARTGRKMGHLTLRASSLDEAIQLGRQALNPIREKAGLPPLAT
ncbi:MAG: 5-(carboxyamino)imidazole ribonucleotide synthase [Verrucomicrobia bacterium]|nr:5-(carboxyamino)imidazole ribonucleotide synthase [Verrucomicrobiota bacterium]